MSFDRSVLRLLLATLALVLLTAAPVHAAWPGRHGGGANGSGPSTTQIYLSATGSGSSCTLGAPCSLTQAQTNERAAIAAGHCADVIARDGLYFLSSTLAFTSADSGTARCPTTLESYPGEVAQLSGGIQVTGWVLCTTADAVCGSGANGVYQASIALSVYPREFYFGATPTTMAHRTRAVAPGTYPAGFSSNTSTGVITGPSSGTYAAIASWGNPTDIELVFRGGWREPRCKVASISGTPATINMNASCASYMVGSGWPNNFSGATNNPYQVENAYELLPSCGAGCWYYNRTTHILYYHPNGGEDLSTGIAVVPSLSNVITGVGVSYLTLSRLQPSHQTWEAPDTNGYYQSDIAGYTSGYTPMGAAVHFSGGSNNFTLSHMLLTQNGGRALWVDAASQHCLVYANDFEDNGGGDYQLGGIDNTQANPALQTSDCVARDNKFNGQQFEYRDASGMLATFWTNSTVDHNYVPATPWSSFMLGFGGDTGGGAPRLPGYSNNNMITSNWSANACDQYPLLDCGNFYGNNSGFNTYEFNYASGTPPGSQACFYPDENSGPQTWIANVCDGNNDRALWMGFASIHNITFTSPWYSTNSTIGDHGTSNSIAALTAISAGCGANSDCLAIKNAAGIEAGVTPGPYPPAPPAMLSIVASASSANQGPGACSGGCTPFAPTTTGGNLVRIFATEIAPTSSADFALTCNGTAATLVNSHAVSGSGTMGQWAWDCPSASGTLTVVATKSGNTTASFTYAELHSTMGTPSNDGSMWGYGTGTNVATATLGSPTTNASDLLLECGYQNGWSGGAFTGGGGGVWTGFGSSGLCAYQQETATAAFASTLTATGGTGDTALLLTAAKP